MSLACAGALTSKLVAGSCCSEILEMKGCFRPYRDLARKVRKGGPSGVHVVQCSRMCKCSVSLFLLHKMPSSFYRMI